MNENEVELQSKLAVISIPSNVEEMIILYKVIADDRSSGFYKIYSTEDIKDAEDYAYKYLSNGGIILKTINEGSDCLEGVKQ